MVAGMWTPLTAALEGRGTRFGLRAGDRRDERRGSRLRRPMLSDPGGPTGTVINNMYDVGNIGLRVQLPAQAPYDVMIEQSVPTRPRRR